MLNAQHIRNTSQEGQQRVYFSELPHASLAALPPPTRSQSSAPIPMPDDAAASPAPPPEAVDRAATCPFLLRVFWSERRHNDLQAYGDTPGSGVTPPNELRLYAWEDCTLRELADMVKHERAETRRPRASRRDAR
ncbi:hypothetical protein JL720_3522 [Aureococcus anophagefferens]|nr:hypothetical protein JL720_3522 [Aureococcus anophagefferens]